VRQYVDDGFLKIIFVKSQDNLSDRYTKNTSIKIYKRHHGEFVADKIILNMTIITLMIGRVLEGS
jgi:hypothetical protein